MRVLSLVMIFISGVMSAQCDPPLLSLGSLAVAMIGVALYSIDFFKSEG